MKKSLSTIVLVALLFVGLSLLLYPTASEWWNSSRQTRAVASYDEVVEAADTSSREEIWASARAYNADLAEQGNAWKLSSEQEERYDAQLVLPGTEVMSYVEIPAIRCSLPIYHGTNEAVLQVAVGHIEGSSLPVGGESSHCVLSAHRGLPSSRLFTDLDQLAVGDVFMLRTLDKTLTYEVDRIRIVLPHELDDLRIQEGEDLCTLVTCTPYGVNSHRLLVRGHRVENLEDELVTADALRVDSFLVAVCLVVPVLLVLFAGSMLAGRKKKPRSGAKPSDAL